MKRVVILGCAGAGKSTLARKLGEKTGFPVVHLDKLFWKSGWIESAKEEIDEKILEEIRKDCWIMDGNYTRTLSVRLQRCDTVIYLDFPRWLCLWSVLKRVACSYGRVRPDMPEGCPERIDWEFLVWIWNFNKKNRKRFYEMLHKLDEKQVYILKKRRDVKQLLEML